MKFKKMLSLFAASAIAVSSFAGLGISASAKQTTATVNTIYHANDIFPDSGNTDVIAVDTSKEGYYNDTLGAPFGEFSEITSAKFGKQTGVGGADKAAYIDGTDGSGAVLNYNITTAGTYTLSVLVVEYNKRYPNIYVDNAETPIIDGASLSGLEKIGTYGTSRGLAVIQAKLENLSAGPHSIKFTTPSSSDKRVQGVIAAVLNGEPEPTPEPTVTPSDPSGAVILKYPSSKLANGTDNPISTDFIFVDNADAKIKSFFADSSDSTKIAGELVANKKNYICGTATNGTHPTLTASLPAGTYKMYYLGYDHGQNITATFASTGKTITAGAGANLAYDTANTSYVLKVYTLEFTLDAAVTNETITFDSTQQWLPDMYAIVITNQESAPEVTPAPETTTSIKVITADDMTAVGNGNGTPSLSSTTITEATDAYVNSYQNVFGESFKYVDGSIYGYLGDGSRGHLETTFTTTADGACTLDVLASYARNSNLITVTDSEGNVILDAVSPTQSEKMGAANWDLHIYTATIDNLPAGTYTFKWHSAGSCSDFLALGITSASSDTAPEIPDAPEIDTPFTGVYVGNGSQIKTGNTNSDNTTYTFADGLDDIVYDIFGDESDPTKVNKNYTSKYLNYIGGTSSSSKGKPYISGLNLAAGAYKIYFVGRSNTGNDVIATIGNTEVKTKNYVKFANNGSDDLNLYTLDLTLTEAVSNGTIYFNCPNYWLPDLYCVAITNEAVSYAVTGTITADDGASFNGDAIKFISARGKEFSTVVGSGNAFAVALPKGEYTAFIDNTYYRVKASSDPITVSGNTTGVNVAVEKETAKNVKVTLINAPANGTEISFGNVKVAFAAGETEKTVSLEPGVYTIDTTEGKEDLSALSKTALTVAHEDTYKNIYYEETIPVASSFNVTVGSNGEYKTITDALAGIAKLGTPTATNRATITLAAGETFREQVRVNVPYVTITTDASNPAKVTWYYGIGCTYYSLGADGWYNKDRAMTKIDKLAAGAKNWGATITLEAEGIKLENLYIENSFNQYYTDEEFADGVEPNGLPDCGQQDRTTLKANGVAADSSTATERACALYFRSSKNEFYNCTVISSQDTIGTGGSAYFNDCTLVGNTDYICAGGDIVFDNCDLLFGGYSDTAKGGALTAANGDDSYIFRDCTIGNYQNAAGTRQHGTHSYGRDWGGEKAHVFFLNCDVQDGTSIKGWGNMGGAVTAGTADLHVYDFSNPGAYTGKGTNDPYNITAITFETAAAKYEGALDSLGFTPEKIATAETITKALDGVEDTEKNDYVYGVVTEITAGESAAITSVTWTIKDASNNTYNFSTDDVKDGVSVINKGTFPTISGGGSATISMIFHAPQGTYDVVSQAE